MPKHLIKMGILVTLTFLVTPLYSVTNPSAVNVDKFAILVKRKPHIKVAIRTILESQSGVEGLQILKAKIIVCGRKAIKYLKTESELKPLIKKALKSKIQLYACEISMKKSKVKRKELISGVKITSNGLREIIKLKAQGYVGVEI